MPSTVRAALVQTTWTGDKETMIKAHEEYAREAASQGAQVICFQELFYGPYFCQVQEAAYYEYAESIPGPTTERFQALAAELGMVMVLPMYEQEQPGVLYNTAAVVDADGSYLGKYRKHHIPQVKGFWEKFYFRPGNLGFPVFDTAVGKVGVYICYDRHFPEGWRALGLNGAQIVFNPSATHRGPVGVPLEARAAGLGGRQRVLRRRHQPGRHRGPRRQRLLRHVLLRRPRGQVRRRARRRPRARARRPRPRHGAARRGAQPLGVLPRPTARGVRPAHRPVGEDRTHGTHPHHRRHRREPHRVRSPPTSSSTARSIAALYAPGVAAATGVTAERTIDATGKYVVPGGIDPHVHMNLPFGGTFSSDDFETGTAAAAWGGTTTIIDFGLQTTGEIVQDKLAARHEEAAGVCAIDYGFHMILGDVTDEALKAMDELVRNEGVTSFKLFMAYPGVFYSDDAQILRAMQSASNNGATIMMHAENGIAIDVLAAQAVERGDTDPVHHGIVRRSALEGEATNRAIVLADVAGNVPLYFVHLSASEALAHVAAARDARPQRVRRDVPAVPLPHARGPARRARLRGRQVGVLAAAAHQARAPPRRPLERPAHQRPRRRVHRPLPVLLQGPEGARHRRLPGHPQRHGRGRAPDGPHLPGRRRRQAHRSSGGSRRARPRRPGCSACSRARGSSPRAPTPTSSCTTRAAARRSRTRRPT